METRGGAQDVWGLTSPVPREMSPASAADHLMPGLEVDARETVVSGVLESSTATRHVTRVLEDRRQEQTTATMTEMVTRAADTTTLLETESRGMFSKTTDTHEHSSALRSFMETTSWNEETESANVSDVTADLVDDISRDYGFTDMFSSSQSYEPFSISTADASADVQGRAATHSFSAPDERFTEAVTELTGANSSNLTGLFTSEASNIMNKWYSVVGEDSRATSPLADISTRGVFSYSDVTITSLQEMSAMTNNSAMFDDVTRADDLYAAGGDDVTSAAVIGVKAVTLTLLAIGGVVGNALVIWSVVRQRHLHRPPFYYLLSMSLTDLSRAAFCLPLVLMTLLQGSVWRHGNSACDLFAFANSFFVLSSSVSLLDVAADRHFSLVYARSYRKRAGGAVNLVVVLLGWTLAFLVAFPPVVGVGAYAFQASEAQCTLQHKSYRENDTLGFLMVFTGLSLLTLFLYYRIFLALRTHRRMRPLQHEPARSATWTFVGPGANGQAFVNWVNGLGRGHQVLAGPLPTATRNPPRPDLTRVVSLHASRNQHVTRLFFIMTLAFTLLWLPYQVVSYWRVFGDVIGMQSGFVTVSAWLSYAQVALCPVVYFLVRGPTRQRPSRAEVSPDDKQEFLLESFNRKK